jgi:DNA-binding HxlR family transcriptional regulator
MDHLNCPNAQAEHAEISITNVVQLVGDMWTLLIVSQLMCGSLRFGQLQERLNKISECWRTSISPNTLSQRLKTLEAGELITRQSYPEIPPRVEYSLTEKGIALYDIIKAMSDFQLRYMPDAETSHSAPAE